MKCKQPGPWFETRTAVSASYDNNHYSTSTGGYQRVHNFPKGVNPEVSIIARMEFELSICLCLPPDKARRKVNSPKAD